MWDLPLFQWTMFLCIEFRFNKMNRVNWRFQIQFSNVLKQVQTNCFQFQSNSRNNPVKVKINRSSQHADVACLQQIAAIKSLHVNFGWQIQI